MPEKLIDIPGVGVIGFPESMKDDDISFAIQRQYGHLPELQPSQAAMPAPPALSGVPLVSPRFRSNNTVMDFLRRPSFDTFPGTSADLSKLPPEEVSLRRYIDPLDERAANREALGGNDIVERGLTEAGQGVAQMSQPGERAAGANAVITGLGKAALPLAIGALVKAPVATMAGAAAGTAGTLGTEVALEQGFDMDPEIARLLGTGVGALLGGAAFRGAKGRLDKLANPEAWRVTNESVRKLHQVLGPTSNDQDADQVIREAVPIIRQYDPTLNEIPAPTMKQRVAGPLIAPSRAGEQRPGGAQGPTLKSGEIGDRPGVVVRTAIGAAENAGDDMLSTFDAALKPWYDAGATIEGREVAAAMRAAIPQDILPQVSQSALEMIAAYERRGQVPLQEAVSQLRSANAQLNGFYRKNLAGQGIAERTNVGDAAVEEARARALRSAIYSKISESDNGKAPAELMRLYGQVADFKNLLYQRLNEALRGPAQGPIDRLTTAAVHTIMRHPGGPAYHLGQAMREAKGLDNNLLDAFLRFEGPAKTVSITPPPTPAALLERGSIWTGPAEEPPMSTGSPFVRPRGMTEPYPGMGMSPRTGARDLPPPTIKMPGEVLTDASGPIPEHLRHPGVQREFFGSPRQLPPAGQLRPTMATEPGVGSYPGQEPPSGLYRVPGGKFADPFSSLSAHQRSQALLQLQTSGQATITSNGRKMMWRREADGSIRRLR